MEVLAVLPPGEKHDTFGLETWSAPDRSRSSEAEKISLVTAKNQVLVKYIDL
jgi:hypothetical protein